jgi:glutamine amidotransferase-like uncharacterized protein
MASLEWIKQRSEQVMDGSFPEYLENLKLQKHHNKTKKNFMLANRQARQKFMKEELEKFDHNVVEHMSY